MLYSIALHFLAGALTGSLFKIQTLLLLLAFIFAETALLGLLYGGAAALGGAGGLVAIQIGYLCGIYARGVIEQAVAVPSRIRPRRVP